ncbi:unnamed protein product [Discosporangium mesarthrocarpum]
MEMFLARPAPRADKSPLWRNPNIHHQDLGRSRLRSVHFTIPPDASSTDVIGAVAEACHLSGLRLVQRDGVQARLLAERTEAPYLARFSRGRQDARASFQRGPVDSLSTAFGLRTLSSIGREEWRVLSVSLGVSKLSKLGSVDRILLLEFMTDNSSASDESRGTSSMRDVGAFASKLATGLGVGFGTGESSVVGGSAIDFAQHRSKQRADALIEAVTTELEHIGAIGKDRVGYPAAGVESSEDDVSEEVNMEQGGTYERVEMVPWDAVNTDAETRASTAGLIQVKLDVQFVECLCARARETSRQDAQETWRPLEDTVKDLEREAVVLRRLLEPRYRALGLQPPPPPSWADQVKQETGTGTGAGEEEGKVEGGARWGGGVALLLVSSSYYTMEDRWVRASVRPRVESPGAEENPPRSPRPSVAATATPSITPMMDTSGGAPQPTPGDHDAVVRAVTRHLAAAVSQMCEDQSERLTKDRMRASQGYVVELEAYRTRIVEDLALQPVPVGGGGGAGISELGMHFGVVTEALLYSAPAALGKKPGRVYVTGSTLWFHSKVLSFESRYILPLSNVTKASVLCTALDISASFLLTTTTCEEIMLVFPGKGSGSLEPLEVLVRQLLKLNPCTK